MLGRQFQADRIETKAGADQMLVQRRALFLQQFDFFGSYAAIDLLQFSKTVDLALELRGHLLASLSDNGGNAAGCDAVGGVDQRAMEIIKTAANNVNWSRG